MNDLTDNWVKNWFNSPYYHILYKDRDFSEAEAFITRLLLEKNYPKTTKILDLACGKGRHSIYLSKMGYQVWGMDISEESIKSAKKQETANLHFAVQDMRDEIPHGPFNLVLNLFTSFGYFDEVGDHLVALKRIKEVLSPHGELVLDFFNTQKTIRDLIETEIKTIEGITFHITRHVINGWIIKDIEFKDGNQKFKFQERVRALKQEDFVSFFAEAGFTVNHLYGDYNLSEYDERTSDRMIFNVTAS